MNRLAVAILIFVSIFAYSKPCQGIQQAISPSRKAKLEPAIAKQLNLEKVVVNRIFQKGAWYIIHVGTYSSDDRFLFYHGDPLTSLFITEWGGVAARHEGNEIMQWAKLNAKGIPDQLAACFARFVTRGL